MDGSWHWSDCNHSEHQQRARLLERRVWSSTVPTRIVPCGSFGSGEDPLAQAKMDLPPHEVSPLLLLGSARIAVLRAGFAKHTVTASIYTNQLEEMVNGVREKTAETCFFSFTTTLGRNKLKEDVKDSRSWARTRFPSTHDIPLTITYFVPLRRSYRI